MTNRERLIAIMEGRSPDQIPWIPRMLPWYTARQKTGTMPEPYRDYSLRELEKALGMGTPAREGRVFRTEMTDVETVSRQEGKDTVTEYITPVGTVSSRTRYSQELSNVGLGGMEVEHIIKGPEDFPAVEFMVTHTRYIPTYEEYLSYDREIREDGMPMVHGGDCPFHHFLQKLVGYNHAYFHLSDYPDQVEHLLELMTEIDREMVWPILADSPARLVLHGVHFDSQITPRPLFERYIQPYYQEFSELLHAHGKTLCMHADNDSRLLLSLIKASGFDMAETFTTAPMVTCTLSEARAAWGTEVIIWGGVPSVILEDQFPDAEFEAYMKDLFRTVAPGDAFILGVADNVMPRARLDRLLRITEMAATWGRYPVQVDE